jgi:putative acetyltransferase
MPTQPILARQEHVGRDVPFEDATVGCDVRQNRPMTESALRIRAMRHDEFEDVRRLEVSAFSGDESIGALLDELRSSWAWVPELSFVAEQNSDVCAHVLFTRAILDAPNRLVDVLVLGPAGVRPQLHRQGIGTALISQALNEIAAERPEPAVFVEGDPRYYARFGFEPACSIGFRRPSSRIPEPAFQVFRLPSFDESLTGTLVYPDAFWRTDSVGLR